MVAVRYSLARPTRRAALVTGTYGLFNGFLGLVLFFPVAFVLIPEGRATGPAVLVASTPGLAYLTLAAVGLVSTVITLLRTR